MLCVFALSIKHRRFVIASHQLTYPKVIGYLRFYNRHSELVGLAGDKPERHAGGHARAARRLRQELHQGPAAARVHHQLG